MVSDGVNCCLLQSAGWLWRTTHKAERHTAYDSAAGLVHRVLVDCGHRQPSRRPHSCASGQSSKPFGVDFCALVPHVSTLRSIKTVGFSEGMPIFSAFSMWCASAVFLLEGYRISREISDSIVRGELPNGPQDLETLQAAMATQGYSVAFNVVLARSQRKAPVDTDLILDLYEALFRPSVDSGITDSAALRGWRNSSVGLRGWRHVPPNPKKIPDLIGGLERFAARKDLSPIGRALLVHLEFVTIHPFMDGNGRLGRLLMNHVLLSAGLPWVTIRSDERVPFFKAIEHAQVDGDTVPFIRFVWHLIQQSAMDLQRKRSGRKPARKTPRRRPE